MNTEQLRKLCLSLPHATEDVKWGHDLCFSVGGKIFCVTDLEGDFAISFKAEEDKYHELVESGRAVPAPYLARYKWVQVRQPDNLSVTEWNHCVRKSYELVRAKLPKKAPERLG